MSEANVPSPPSLEVLHAHTYEYAALGVVVVSPQRRFIAANRHFCTMVGYEETELLGKSFRDITYPDDYGVGSDLFESVARGDEPGPIHFEKRYVRADGETLWVSLSMSAIRNDDGEIRCFLAQITDISESKALISELREQTWLLGKSQEVTNVGHWQLNAKTMDVIGSDQLFEIFEIGRDDATLESFVAVVHPEDREYDVAHIQRGLDEGKSWDIEHRLLCRSGEIKHVRAAGEATLNDDGSVRHLFGTIQDITKQHEAAEAVRAGEQRLRTILDATVDSLVTIDREGSILEVNRAATELFGYAAVEMVGHPVSMLMAEPDASRHQSYVEKYAETGVSTVIGTSREVDAVSQDGTTIPIRLRVREAEYAGRPVFIGTIQDLREQKELESRLAQAQKMEAIGRLAGGVAHDFNNLLTVIRGRTDLLLRQLTDPALTTGVKQISQAADHATALTQQLLAFSRRQVLQPTVSDLSVIVSQMRDMVGRLVPEDIRFVAALDPQLDKVRVDQTQIAQVILNLVANAKDAMPTGGTLTIETGNVKLTEEFAHRNPGAAVGPFVRLTVRDTGTGMSEGTGLGLATVYGIVKQSAGFILVHSQEGHGTEFSVYFPRADVDEEVAPDTPGTHRTEGPDHAETRGATILLVEDDADVRSLTRDLLTLGGHQVLEAETCAHAIEICRARNGQIDLLITDVVMPTMSGPQLAEQLRSVYADIKILFVSGYMDESLRRHRALVPGTRLLAKPFTFEELDSHVRQALSGTD